MSHKFYDLTFTPAVKATQEHYGTRKNYARFEGGEPDFHGITDVEVDFLAERDGFYMATVGEEDQPYIQFRGGPKGFLKVLDDRTLGFADFRGNLQYISVGNLTEHKKAAIFLMDYAGQRRLKILVRVEVKDAAEAPDLIAKLKMPDYKARVERAMILHIQAFDWNCPQHITPRYTMDEIRLMTAPLNEHMQRFYSDVVEICIVPPAKSIAYRCLIDRRWLRISTDSLRQLYGGSSQAPWTMVGQITHIPAGDAGDTPSVAAHTPNTESEVAASVDEAAQEAGESAKPPIQDIRGGFSAMLKGAQELDQKFITNSSRPEVVIAPLALYREMLVPIAETS